MAASVYGPLVRLTCNGDEEIARKQCHQGEEDDWIYDVVETHHCRGQGHV